MSYKLYTDKTETFKCKIHLEAKWIFVDAIYGVNSFLILSLSLRYLS